MLLFKFLVLALSVLIFMEDIRSRSVHWFLFPLLAAALFLSSFRDNNLHDQLQQTSYNICFVLVQLFVLTFYLSVKRGRLIKITDGLLGWGDILFLISITISFSLVNFVLFYILSLFLSLVIWSLVKLTVRNIGPAIPLAGFQALIFGALFLVAWLHPTLQLNNDYQAVKWLFL